MKLFYTKRSPYARKVRIMALEKNIQLDLVDEDLAKKSPELLKANPLGKVPTLLLNDGRVIFDSVVICQFLEETAVKPVLIPAAGRERTDVLKWEALADDLVTTAINVYMEKVRHPKDFHAQFILNGEAAILKTFQYMDDHIHDLEQFNLGSIAAACAIGYVHFRLPHLAVKGNLKTWFDTISQRPSLAQTLPVA